MPRLQCIYAATTTASSPVISFQIKIPRPLTLLHADIYIFIRVLIFLFTRLVAPNDAAPSHPSKIRASIFSFLSFEEFVKILAEISALNSLDNKEFH